MRKVRQTLAIKVATPGGDNPLLMSLVAANAPYYRGIAVSGLALVGRGGTAPYSFVKLTGTIPTGLTLHTDGTFTGTPSVPGRFTFVAQVTDSASDTFAHAFSIDILSPLFLVGALPQNGEIAVVYDYQFIVRDATGTTITSGYSISAGSLPPGLSMDTAGHITGTPTAPAGISYATLKVVSGPDTLLVPFEITIFEAVALTFVEDRDPPAGWGGGAGSWLPSMVRGIDYTASLVITGGCPPYSLSASQVDPLPSGITLRQQRLVIAGKTMDAAAPQPFLLAIQVTDAVGGIDLAQRAFFIIDSQQGRVMPQRNGTDVSGGDGPLNWSFKEGSGISITATNDGETVEYTFDASAGPAGNFLESINGAGPDSGGNLSLVSHDGSVTITQDSHGDINFHVTASGSGTVTNVSSGNLSPLFTVNVSNPTTTPTFGFTAVNQNSNLIYAGPATGAAAAPTFRSLVTADFPTSGVSAGTYTLATVTVDATGRITSASSGTAGQTSIQFQDDGSNLGTSGTATTVNFTGAGVAASRVSNTVTVNVDAATAAVPMFYGDGSDGTVLLDGTNTFSFMSQSVNTYTLTRDVYCNTLSSNGTGVLITNGFRIWCYTTLDLSSFPAAGITRNGNPGVISANETAGGAAGGGLSANTLGSSLSGSVGGGGVTGVGNNGAAISAAAGNGGGGGVGGNGGAGTNAGGSGGTVGAITPFVFRRPQPEMFAISSGSTQTALVGGQGGSGGGAGGGNGVANGAAGGGGGGAAAIIYIAARDIVKPTVAGVVQAVGGTGGAGATRTAGTGNQGGGGGGAGGGGGLIHLVYNSTSGSGTGTVVATGGTGGAGGLGRIGGANGVGGTGGTGGLILLFNIGAGTTTSIVGSAGSAGSGTTGGAGGACSTTL